jgi:hypothetical protein
MWCLFICSLWRKIMQSNHVRAIVLSFVMIVGIAACSSTSDTTTLPTTIIIDGTVGGNMMALELDGQPLTVSSQATVRLRGQNALATVVRPGVRLRGTATRDANGRLNLLEGDVSYSRALSGVLQSVSDNSITLQQGERSLTLPLADNLLIHGEVNRADSLPIGRQVTAFGSDDSGGLIIVLELWSAAVTMNTPGVSAPNVSDGDVSDGDASEDVDSGDNGGNNGGNNGGSDGNGEQVFINLPLVRADRNAGVLQLGHPSNALEVRINADTMLDAGSPNPNAFWQAATEGAPVIVEGALAADGVITAWYVAILPSDIEPVPWLALEGRVQQVQPGRGFVLGDSPLPATKAPATPLKVTVLTVETLLLLASGQRSPKVTWCLLKVGKTPTARSSPTSSSALNQHPYHLSRCLTGAC